MDYNEFNFKLAELKNNLYSLLENSSLPLGSLFYLIKDLYNNLQNQYIASVNSYNIEHPNEQNITDEMIQEEKKNSQVE